MIASLPKIAKAVATTNGISKTRDEARRRREISLIRMDYPQEGISLAVILSVVSLLPRFIAYLPYLFLLPDLIIDDPIVSNRHCLIYTENKGGDSVAVIEDISANGTFVNDHLIGRNNRRELQDQDEITILDKARFVFRYPKNRYTSSFSQRYTLLEKLGKGHFAEVFLCVEKATGQRYAVKIFTKQAGVEDRSKTEGLQQEIAVLMGVTHPNMLCLKDTFEESNAVYIVLELAAEGELFNWIVMKQKLTEDETRKVFLQLFHGVKYLVRPLCPNHLLITTNCG